MNSTIQALIGGVIGTIIFIAIRYVLYKVKIHKMKKRLGFNHDRFDRN